MNMSPLATIAVGVLVERSTATSRWADFVWRPTAVLAGQPDTAVWTKLADEGERATFYAGPASIELHRSETGNYRDNLASGAPSLWVVLRETGAEPPYSLFLVTADPSEGEGMTAAGNDLVEAVPMPESVREQVAAFVAEHHVEREFFKRKRDRVDPQSLGRRPTAPRDDG
jgi:Protein of unknown function (DUF3305)